MQWAQKLILNVNGKLLRENCCRSPCEVVSWNELNYNHPELEDGRPPREVVSWNASSRYGLTADIGRPPCEVVSWNADLCRFWLCSRCRPPCEVVSWNVNPNRKKRWGVFVDLLVRSWVEIIRRPVSGSCGTVDLLARSWVEIIADLLVSDNS